MNLKLISPKQRGIVWNDIMHTSEILRHSRGLLGMLYDFQVVDKVSSVIQTLKSAATGGPRVGIRMLLSDTDSHGTRSAVAR